MMTFDEIKHVINNVKFDADGIATNLEWFSKKENKWYNSYLGINAIIRVIYEHKYIYRIKPEPEHVPYTADDWREFLGEKFVSNGFGYGVLVIDYDLENVNIYDDSYSYQCFLEDFTKLDGTPAGKLKVAE